MQHTGEVDTPRDGLVVDGHIPGDALTSERHGIQAGSPLDNGAVERNFLTRTYDNGLAHLHLFGRQDDGLAITQYGSRVGSDIHEVGDGVAALALGIFLEQFAHLEEKHDKDRLGKFCLCSRKEADDEGTDGGYRHEKMLVERFAMGDALSRLA